jgi:hypothetical protein
MTNVQQLILTIIARHTHIGVFDKDLHFATRNYGMTYKKILQEETLQGHIEETSLTNGRKKYKLTVKNTYPEIPLHMIDEKIFKIHQTLQRNTQGLLVTEIANKLNYNVVEVQEMIHNELSHDFVHEISLGMEKASSKYRSSLSIDVENLVQFEYETTIPIIKRSKTQNDIVKWFALGGVVLIIVYFLL